MCIRGEYTGQAPTIFIIPLYKSEMKERWDGTGHWTPSPLPLYTAAEINLANLQTSGTAQDKKRNISCTKYLHTVFRVQSSVWRLPNYCPTPSQPSECVLPPHQRRGGTHSPGSEGEGGVNISEDASCSIIPSTISWLNAERKILYFEGQNARRGNVNV